MPTQRDSHQFRRSNPAQRLYKPLFFVAMLVLLLINVLALVCLSFMLEQRQNTQKENIETLHLIQADAYQLQAAFRLQIQEWKNTLLRGQQDSAFHKYMTAFRQQQSHFDSICHRLLSYNDSGVLPTQLQEIIELHRKVSNDYFNALLSYKSNEDVASIDAKVRGVDRPLQKLLDNYYQQVLSDTLTRKEKLWADLNRFTTFFVIFMLALNIISIIIATIISKRSMIYQKNHEAKLQTIMRAAPAGILLFDATGQLLEANGHALNLLDKDTTRDDIIWHSHIDNEDRNEFMRRWQEAIDKSTDCYHEFKIKRNNGSTRWAAFHAIPESQVSSGAGFIASLSDISNAKSVETLLRNNEERLRTILQSLADAVIATDIHGKIQHMNPSAELLTAWNSADAENLPIEDVCLLLNSKTHEPIDNPVTRAIDHLDIIDLHTDVKLLSQDDSEHYITGSATPIFNDQDTLTGSVLVFRDISDQITLQHQLRHADKMQSIGQLTGGIAHDFNNMLGAIMGATQVLDTLIDDTDLQKREYIQIIMRVSENAADLVRNLLTFSRNSKNEQSDVDINKLLQETADIARHALSKRISLTCTTINSTCYSTGDQSAIQSMILNLCINAQDAMPDGGSLSISSSTQQLQAEEWQHDFPHLNSGYFVKISITDTGHGMEPELTERIFEPFFTTKERGKGTGLGLSTVYGTINSHAGCISVQSKPGNGTAFHIYLPLNENSSYASSAARLSSLHSNQFKNILLVDDDDNLRPIIKSLIESLGYNVLAASGGKAALSLLEEYKDQIAVVFLDLVMPEMSGRETFVEIQAMSPNQKIVLISGYDRGADSEHLMADGAIAYLRKPFSMQLVSEILNEHAPIDPA